jgi:hypothetical protein
MRADIRFFFRERSNLDGSVRSSIDPVDRADEIHLPDADAMMTQDGVGHDDVEIRVRYDYLQ